MVEQDKWRHVRAVLSKRTPDSELLVHRAGGEIVAGVGEVMERVMVLRVPEGIPQARADADLDALSALWNTAGELLADAERGARTTRTPAPEHRPDPAEGRRLLAEARAAADGPAWAIPLRRDAAEHWLYLHADELLADADALAGALKEVERLRAALAAIERDATTVLSLHRADPTGVVDIIRKTASAALAPGTGGATDGNG